MGVTNRMRELFITLQEGDSAEGGESSTQHELLNEPVGAGRKWLPTKEIMLPSYASVPENATVGNKRLTDGACDTFKNALSWILFGFIGFNVKFAFWAASIEAGIVTRANADLGSEPESMNEHLAKTPLMKASQG